MKKTAILTDSNSGITQAHAKELGIFAVPMPFTINGEEYFEDINLTKEQFYQFLEGNATIFTSQPAIGALSTIWDEILKEYDEILFIPMSSSLSGTYQSAKMLAEQEYEGKVFVVDSQRIAVMQYQDVMDAIQFVSMGKTALEIATILEENKANNVAYLVVPTLEYLKRGGRVTASAAALGSLLKIKPVLQLKGGKIDAFKKARTMSKAYSMMVDAIRDDLKNDFKISEEDAYLYIVHTNALEEALELKKYVEQEFNRDNILVMDLSLSVACHVGPNTLAIACAKKII